MKFTKQLRSLMGLLLLSALLTMTNSCSEINFDMPPGPDGKSVYEVWVEEVNKGTYPEWPKDKTDVTDFLVFIKGEKGDKGEDGKSAYDLWRDLISNGDITNPHNPNETWSKDRNTEADFWDYLTGRDGVSPHVGDNGNWWIGTTDTGVVVKGKDGVDGTDGITPHIGENGNWWIGITDTGTSAKGQDGVSPHIGDNGNWFVGSTDTKVPAKGQDGIDGRSAYDIWKEKAETGNLDDPKDSNSKWPKDKAEVEHFIQYLTGANGKDGVNGVDGKDGSTPYIGENGNWFVGTTDTGVKAQGQNGADGISPHIGTNGNWFVGTTDTGVPAKGQNGLNGTSPHIGDNGNWWIGTTDTGVKAQGENGTNGADGKSAYELWIEDVKKGSITDPNTGAVWPADKITQADFWNYLKGKDGKDGTNGVNGQSAYEIWKDLASTGTLDDPRNPDVKWPKDKVSETDFWSFLMGKDGKDGVDGLNGVDGKSAYELWKEEVAKGLDNPHEPGTEWPKDKISTDNFWEFLSGKDGKDGIAGKPGEPGQPIEIVTGVPNVIAQYALQEYSEYVRWSDGGVLYKVYDNVGQPAPGAKIKGLPGLDPNKEYIADEKGEFLMPKEDLPEGKGVSELVGKTAEVTYVKSTGVTVTEASAANTYVPNKMQVRLVRRQNFTIDGRDINVYVRCERNDGRPDSEWTIIPSYLGNLTQSYKAFELSDANDPTSYDENSTPYLSEDKNISANSIPLYVRRHHVKPNWLLETTSPEWDGKDHYYIIRMESYYGEQPILPAVIKSAPIQYVPMIKSIKNVKAYSESLDAVQSLTVEFDVSQINLDLIFNSYKLDKTLSISGTDFEYWVPVKHSTPQSEKSFQINFVYKNPLGGDITSNNTNNKASINTPESIVLNTHVKASVSLSVHTTGSIYNVYFTSLGPNVNVGRLEFDKENGKVNFIGIKNSTMTIPDILDIPVGQ